jgi:RNA-directed DNA polymerase
VEDEIMKVKGAFPIRFADDILVFGETMDQMEKVKELIIEFLKPRGLELNEGKTSIKTIEEGIDFLGYNIREYPDETRVGKKGKPTKKGILIVKPSKTKIENFKKTIKGILTKMRNHGAGKVIMKLNPIIRG